MSDLWVMWDKILVCRSQNVIADWWPTYSTSHKNTHRPLHSTNTQRVTKQIHAVKNTHIHTPTHNCLRLLWLMSNRDLSPCPGVCCIVFCARVEDGGSVLLILPKKKLFGELLVNGGFIAVWEHLPRHKINNINVIVSYANVCCVLCVWGGQEQWDRNKTQAVTIATEIKT